MEFPNTIGLLLSPFVSVGPCALRVIDVKFRNDRPSDDVLFRGVCANASRTNGSTALVSVALPFCLLVACSVMLSSFSSLKNKEFG